MKQRDIFLVPFPFSDLSGSKVRPCVIVSKNDFNKRQDVLICAISGTPKGHTVSLESGKLHKTCYVDYQSIHKIQKTLLLKKIGSLQHKVFQLVKKDILSLF